MKSAYSWIVLQKNSHYIYSKYNPVYLIFSTPFFPECHSNFTQVIYLMKSGLTEQKVFDRRCL